MVELEFELDFGTGFGLVPPPRNWKGLQIRVLFIENRASPSIDATPLEWVGDNAVKINQWINNGLSGGYGIFEGIGIKIFACKAQRIEVFKGFINLASTEMRRSCDMVVAPIRETGRIDWLNDRAASISFAYLTSLPPNTPGRIIPATDFKRTPYTVTEIADRVQKTLVAVQLFLVIRELLDAICRIGQLISDLQGAAATATATLGAGIGLVISSLAMAILYIGYLAGIIIAIVNMIKNLIDNFIQTKKHKLCMTYRDHFIRACQFFGYTFKSTILNTPSSAYYNDTYMPSKYIIPDNTNPLNVFKRPFDEGANFPNNPNVFGYFEGTFADFIVHACTKYNASIAIIGNDLYFEEKHYWNNLSQFSIPVQDVPGNTFNLPDYSGTNASELTANMLVIWSVDQTDLQTLHRAAGTSYAVTISPVSVHNPKNVTLSGGGRVDLGVAHAKRKEYLNNVELLINSLLNALFNFVNSVTSIINGLINVINWVIGIFGGNSTAIPTIPPLPTNILNNRIGWMEVSNDSFAVPKAFIGQQVGTDWLIHPQDEVRSSAKELTNNFHGRNLATRGNQQIVFSDKTFKFCCEDYNKMKNRNTGTAPDGNTAKFVEFIWNLSEERATNVEYRIFRNFTNNLTETTVTDGRG